MTYNIMSLKYDLEYSVQTSNAAAFRQALECKPPFA